MSQVPTRSGFQLSAPLLVLMAAATLLLGVCTSELKAELKKTRPNIVYIMADELGYYELSCLGNPNIRTPVIDQMAKQGMRFTQALAGSSVCAPTRCCLMTGKHSGHTSVRTNGGGTPMRKGEATIASLLKEAGYATGGFGKWGCGGRGSTGVPEKHGFDTFVGYYDQVHAHSYYPPYIVHNSRELPLAGNRGGRKGDTYSHYVIVDKAKEFIRANHKQPFFCYLPITPPHGMFDIPDSDPAWELYKDKDWPEDAKRYAAMVSMVDRQVGEIFELLRELKVAENTLVFFCGDNGGADYFKDAEHPRGFHGANVHPKSSVEFRGRKGNLYEGGLRIPMIAYWPGRIAPGQVSNQLWYFPDVLPTLTEVAGVKTPADVDGISIVPTLLGAKKAGRVQKQHQYLYWELGGQVAVRMQDWKAVRPRQNGDWELYNLKSDVSETKNVAAENAGVLKQIVAMAKEAHEPAREGVFLDRVNHERDRWAKWGDSQPPSRRGKVQKLDKKGLLPNRAWKIARVSSESGGNRRLAMHAIDGNPRTHWHTNFGGEVAKHPHELVIDLGSEREISGFRYLARQDGGWNGALAKCEFYAGEDSQSGGKLVAKVTFRKTRASQEVRCAPVKARYVRLRVLSEVNSGPWASIAELGVIGK